MLLEPKYLGGLCPPGPSVEPPLGAWTQHFSCQLPVSKHEQKAVINMAASRPSRSEIGQGESSRKNRPLVDEVDRQNSQVDRCVRLDRLRGLTGMAALRAGLPVNTI